MKIIKMIAAFIAASQLFSIISLKSAFADENTIENMHSSYICVISNIIEYLGSNGYIVGTNPR